MKRSIKDSLFLTFLLSLLSGQNLCDANDTINATKSISGGDTMVSPGGYFELGFFAPENSKNWYLGIWYKNISVKTVVWVANREIPLKNSSSNVLKVSYLGNLVLLNDVGSIIWSSNTSRVAQNPIVQLLDSGNLILRDEYDNSSENYLWQSFEYPTDTFFIGMNFGWNYLTNVETYLSSWKSNEDPAPGDFTIHLDPSGYPQVITKRGAITLYRVGPWNGQSFSGMPTAGSDRKFTSGLHMNKNSVYYRGGVIEKFPILRFTLNPSGVGQTWVWVDKTQHWVLYLDNPTDNCDSYNLCGAYGSCNIGNFPVCGCLDKFIPKDPQGWVRPDWSHGCVRRTTLNCTNGEGFLKYSNLKLPDARTSWYDESMTLEECKLECLKNCSCMAYTNLNINYGGSGCLLWFEDLLDIRFLAGGGQDLYIRMASSELELKGNRKKLLALSLTTLGMVVLALTLLLYTWKRKNNTKGRKSRSKTEIHNIDLELQLFDLSMISKATNNFSVTNKLGEGGFGPVYKGTLEDGQDIAVKRLSKTSKQGLNEFKNEVICIAKLQHRNLVKLLGCCVQGDEKMLIYEYMPNKSLDLILFDETNRKSLDWPKRFHILNGIARGLLYLHQDSRLRIIHRDLKASNILLDNDMNPKISDFGIAKRFGENEVGDMTSRVVGTYGYISPEYAICGRFSVKSDVFSFGVIMLEIVSGKRNSAFSYGDRHLSFLGHARIAWTLYKQGRSIELVDSCLGNSDNVGQMLRVIHVGLLCVQQHANDRPSMVSVVSMLSNEMVLPRANNPGFFMEANTFDSENISSPHVPSSTNEITITFPLGR